MCREQQRIPTVHGYSTGVFHWSAVRKVDHYQFELASDRKFHAPVLGGAGNFSTRSTSATLSHTLPDGTYWWRVRGIHKNGSVSKWVTHSFKKVWDASTEAAVARQREVDHVPDDAAPVELDAGARRGRGTRWRSRAIPR